MGNSFLEEQLKLVRRLTERMAEIRPDLAKTSDAEARQRSRGGPLQEVRDYRIHQTHSYPDRASDRRRRSGRQSRRKKR